MALAAKHPFSIDWVLLNKGTMRSEGLYVTDRKIAAIAKTLIQAQQEGKGYLVEKTQKDLAADAEFIAQGTANAKAKER